METQRRTPKKDWRTPELAVYGTVEHLTRQTKNKTFGPSDDVILNNQAILATVS